MMGAKHSFMGRLAGAVLTLGFATDLFAAQPFEEAAFEAAQRDGRPVLVDVFAPWCTTCAKQKPILQELERRHPELAVFEIDFDDGKTLLQRFRVQYQSTLILFRNGGEIARSTGETDAGRIEEMIRKGL